MTELWARNDTVCRLASFFPSSIIAPSMFGNRNRFDGAGDADSSKIGFPKIDFSQISFSNIGFSKIVFLLDFDWLFGWLDSVELE